MKEKSSCSPAAKDYIRTEVHLAETTLIRLEISTVSDLTLEVSVPDLIPRIQLTFSFIIKIFHQGRPFSFSLCCGKNLLLSDLPDPTVSKLSLHRILPSKNFEAQEFLMD